MYIRKSSGEKELFDPQKFMSSLKKSGADQKTINTILKEVRKHHFSSTKELYNKALILLQEYAPPVADRYNLKRALMELGPIGFPFEQYVAQLFNRMGYSTQTNRIIEGYCVEHEVDVLAKKKDRHCMIECKFHNRRGLKADVKVALYVQARFEDIKQAVTPSAKERLVLHEAWLVTNTNFTTEAIKYAQCRSLHLLAWNYPFKNNLAQLITQYQLFPITTLTSLTAQQKRAFIKKGFVLCADAPKNKDLLLTLGFSPNNVRQIISEAMEVCTI